MLRKMLKLFGDTAPRPGEVDPETARRRILENLPKTDQNLVTTSTLGRTLVATIVDPDLTAPKVADLSEQLRRVMEATPGISNLVLDLQNVEYLDSACLNFFVDMLNKVKRGGGKVGIAALAQRVEVLFKLTRLDLVFSIRRTVIEAIDAVERQAAA